MIRACDGCPHKPIDSDPERRVNAMTSTEKVLRELAADGVWTQCQLDARLAASGGEPPSRYLSRISVIVKPTGWAHRRVRIGVVRPNNEGCRLLRSIGVRTQEVRPAELEHALGLAELRWRCGISVEHYRGQAALGREHRRGVARGSSGLGPAVADGVFELDGGVGLLEYDHGRYTTRQILGKLGGFRSITRLEGRRIVRIVWGAPTEERAQQLHNLGVGEVMVLRPESWLV
jgi:hypothetical protein